MKCLNLFAIQFVTQYGVVTKKDKYYHLKSFVDSLLRSDIRYLTQSNEHIKCQRLGCTCVVDLAVYFSWYVVRLITIPYDVFLIICVVVDTGDFNDGTVIIRSVVVTINDPVVVNGVAGIVAIHIRHKIPLTLWGVECCCDL